MDFLNTGNGSIPPPPPGPPIPGSLPPIPPPPPAVGDGNLYPGQEFNYLGRPQDRGSSFTKDHVSSTISRDAAGGNKAQEDKILSGLAERTLLGNQKDGLPPGRAKTPNVDELLRNITAGNTPRNMGPTEMSNRGNSLGPGPNLPKFSGNHSPAGLPYITPPPPMPPNLMAGSTHEILPPIVVKRKKAPPRRRQSFSSDSQSESDANSLSDSDQSSIVLSSGWRPNWSDVISDQPQDARERTNDHGESSDPVPPVVPGDRANVPDDPRLSSPADQIANLPPEHNAANRRSDHVELDDAAPRLARNLALYGTTVLGLRFDDNTLEGQFLRHALDVLERQETINTLLCKRSLRRNWRTNHVPPLARVEDRTVQPSAATERSPSPLPKQVEARTLHRIFCSNHKHRHHRALYLDEPKMATVDSAGANYTSGILQAHDRVSNLDKYLSQNTNISFIVTKEHVCFSKDGVDSDPTVFSPRKETLSIVSKTLRDAIEDFATCELNLVSTGQQNLGNPPIMGKRLDMYTMDAPYIFFYHHRSQIAQMLEGNTDEISKTREHLSLLQDFLLENYGDEYTLADEQFKNGLVSKEHYDKLFVPHQLLIKDDGDGSPEAFVIAAWTQNHGQKPLFHGWMWKFDGRALTRIASGGIGEVPPKEPVPMSEIKIYPAKYASVETLQALILRGRKFWSMRHGQFASYSGWDSLHENNYNKARFMIDSGTYNKMHGMHSMPSHKLGKHDRWPDRINVEDELMDHLAMLLPNRVPGFEMDNKKWGILNVDQLGVVEWQKKAFDKLVLDPKSKELIKALVSVHVSTRKMSDIIRGKGNGLIVLLHGTPGVGKTLTAESVAELAEKPLYRVTCGDIGTRAEQAETYLDQVLYLGKKWDCVLLMDEADVFLEERTMADIQRNSLVSVFLRVLESYEGILILTSNRVGTFDEAFKSRIQVAIHYGPLTKKSRRQIWQNFFDALEEQDVYADVGELEGHLDELAAEEMNGRQIRNSLLTAQQLATYKNDRLSWEHLSTALRTTSEFQKYLKNIHGHSDDQWAREERLR